MLKRGRMFAVVVLGLSLAVSPPAVAAEPEGDSGALRTPFAEILETLYIWVERQLLGSGGGAGDGAPSDDATGVSDADGTSGGGVSTESSGCIDPNGQPRPCKP